MVIETYRQHEPDLVIEASRCVFDRAQQAAYSEGDLIVRTADGRFSVEGRGFRWEQSSSVLVISNAVQMAVRRQLLGSRGAGLEAAAEVEPVRILGDHFRYDGKLAVFTGNVRATQEESTVRCHKLEGHFDQEGSLTRLEASGEVHFSQGDLEAGGDHGVYDIAQDRITLEGDARWQAGERSGTAQYLVLEARTRHFTARRQVTVRLPSNQMIAFEDDPPIPANQAATNRFVEIKSGQLEYNPLQAVFSEAVSVSAAGDGRLTAGVLTNLFDPETGRLRRLIAEENVVFEQPGTRIAGAHMVYDAEEDLITVTGNPRWDVNTGSGSSDQLWIRPSERRFRAAGNVEMILAGAQLEALDFSLTPASVRETSQSTEGDQTIFVSAEVADYEPGFAIFREDVRVRLAPRQPRLEGDGVEEGARIQSSQLALLWEGGALNEILAEGGVRVFEGDIEGSGARAGYHIPSGIIELAGGAEIRAPTRRISSDVLYLDRLNQTFRTGAGDFRIEARLRRSR